MAVDSRTKRFSIMGLSNFTLPVFPTNEAGDMDAGDERATMLHLYAGIALSDTAALGGGFLTLLGVGGARS